MNAPDCLDSMGTKCLERNTNGQKLDSGTVQSPLFLEMLFISHKIPA